MPYVIISVQIRSEKGPTLCGDEKQDPILMKSLCAELTQEVGQSFKHYVCPDPPRMVLDRLEEHGYKVISCTGCGQTVLWTCHKEE